MVFCSLFNNHLDTLAKHLGDSTINSFLYWECPKSYIT